MAVAVAIGTLALASPAYLASSGVEISRLTLDDRRVEVARTIGDYVERVTDPADRVAVLWANAGVYWYADRTPAFRYLWLGPLSQIDGAAASARAVITGPDPPTVVVVCTKLDELDPDGEVAAALRLRYRPVLRVGPYPIYQLRAAGLPPARPVA